MATRIARGRLGLILAALLLPVLAFSACSPTYVLRAGIEEAKLLWRRQPIAEMIADPAVDGATRAKLEMVLRLRMFAAEHLGLNVGGSYASVASVDSEQIVHVVTAAERFRLQAYTWWFPIVGQVPYKGFFDRSDAERQAEALEEEGYDTLIRSSVAFSTLGWFDDPLPSNLLALDSSDLANTVIHELLHNTRYFPGQAAFAESFANFAGYRGALEFFRDQGDEELAEALARGWRDSLGYSQYLARLKQRLEREYARGISLAQRQALFESVGRELEDVPLGARLRRRPLNNAVILSELLYHDRLDLFESVYQREGSLRPAITAIIEATEDAGDPFAALAAAAQS